MNSGFSLREPPVIAVTVGEPAGIGPELLAQLGERHRDRPFAARLVFIGDRDLLHTAIRETREELGVELAGARYLGQLTALHPSTGGPNGIEVTPFVFLTEVAVEPTCGPEALAAFWLPLETASAGTLDGMYTYPGSAMTFPSWNYDGHVIWGLTWRILGDVLAAGKQR